MESKYTFRFKDKGEWLLVEEGGLRLRKTKGYLGLFEDWFTAIGDAPMEKARTYYISYRILNI